LVLKLIFLVLMFKLQKTVESNGFVLSSCRGALVAYEFFRLKKENKILPKAAAWI